MGHKAKSVPDVDKKWEREQDVRTLRDAEEIKNDSKRLAAAQTEAKAQMDALDKVRQAKTFDDPSSKEAREQIK